MQKVQSGAFRVNCIDCLDRTNVVQSVLAREVLHAQLTAVGVLRPGETVMSQSPSFERILKTVWADNADQISLLYAGSGALKTDYTRTGKRSMLGLVNDGVNTLQRYYLQNFRDGYRQDAISLAVGATVVSSEDHPRTYVPVREASLWVRWGSACCWRGAVAELMLLHLSAAALPHGVRPRAADDCGEPVCRAPRQLRLLVAVALARALSLPLPHSLTLPLSLSLCLSLLCFACFALPCNCAPQRVVAEREREAVSLSLLCLVSFSLYRAKVGLCVLSPSEKQSLSLRSTVQMCATACVSPREKLSLSLSLSLSSRLRSSQTRSLQQSEKVSLHLRYTQLCAHT